jgi:hypothetical protein
MQDTITSDVVVPATTAPVSPKQANPEKPVKAKVKPEVIAGYEIHPLASIWPLVEGGEAHKELEASIRDMGVINDIIKDSVTGLIIDGRNRLRVYDRIATENPGWAKDHPLPIKELTFASEEEVWAHIKAMNKARRHMTDDQLVAIAVLAGQYLERTKAAKEKTQFKKGGKKAAVVEETKPDGTPVPAPKKTASEYHKTSAGGLIAADAGVGLHKGRQGATAAKGIAKGIIQKDDLKAVAEGKTKLTDVVKKVEEAIPTKKREKLDTDKGASAPKVFKAPGVASLTLEDVEKWIDTKASQKDLNHLFDKLKGMV